MSLRRLATERSLPISLLLFGLLVQACSTDMGPTDPLEPASSTGEILGLVTADGTPVSGVNVTLSRSGSEVATLVTTESGEFGFRNLGAGTYMVAISEIAGTNCSRQQAALVVAGEETEVAFACVTPPPVGTGQVVTGRVTVNGIGEPGLRVLVCYGLPVWEFGCVMPLDETDSEGRYAYTSITGSHLPPGDYVVFVESPLGMSCPEVRTGVHVSSGETVTVDFACTRP